MTNFPDLASKELSFELFTLRPTWNDTSHFRINGQNSGIVNTEIIQRKYISKDRLTPAYDLEYCMKKILERVLPFKAFKLWFQNMDEDTSLSDGACLALIKLIRKEDI